MTMVDIFFLHGRFIFQQATQCTMFDHRLIFVYVLISSSGAYWRKHHMLSIYILHWRSVPSSRNFMRSKSRCVP